MPNRYTSSDDTHAMVARIAPSILELLRDGIPRGRRALFAALADRYSKGEVVRILMRLAVTGQVIDADHKYSLTPATGLDRAEARTGAGGNGAWKLVDLARSWVIDHQSCRFARHFRRRNRGSPVPIHRTGDPPDSVNQSACTCNKLTL